MAGNFDITVSHALYWAAQDLESALNKIENASLFLVDERPDLMGGLTSFEQVITVIRDQLEVYARELDNERAGD
jgi:hypothetical protein